MGDGEQRPGSEGAVDDEMVGGRTGMGRLDQFIRAGVEFDGLVVGVQEGVDFVYGAKEVGEAVQDWLGVSRSK